MFTDCDDLAFRTHEGMALLFRRLGAIGRFGTSPYLVCMYGVGEMSQVGRFCYASGGLLRIIFS